MSSKWNRQINSLTSKQIAFARLISNNGIDSYSQCVKALANQDDERIENWKKRLDALKTEGKLVEKYD